MNNAKHMTINGLFYLRLLLVICSISLWQSVASADEAEESAPEEKSVTDYIEMKPAFVTHVGKPGNKINYLKAAVTLRASSESVRPAVEAHTPRLRHELVMLFGEQTDLDTLSSMEGQQALREEATRRINGVLEEQQTGEQITGVLFTEFVVQR
ncbi:flagellar basal body-associated protein FliL-like protein [Marinobacter litoralis]|uniref:Flagellar protein FliL n=1 Tax=Marinobacter litoralis TaxID=187981 RepID=A0A3M2RBG0_9GAMM|nr:flagellar basal body-associated FliL family protein [Marinobacter litoralis]RMJ02627.1 flagellar basal body-associated protein FliL-like protein [Marinobacter litoralis]